VIHLGTSGYVYDHWRHLFYPKGLPARRWLEHYARVFSTVELNATFYRLPTAALEFRSASWYADEVCAVLEGYGAAFCEHDLVALKPPRLTGGFRYLRFHGATGKYRGRYGKRALRPFARDLLRRPGDAYVYFNNDPFGHALRDALDLSDLVGDPVHCGDVVRDPRRTRAAALE